MIAIKDFMQQSQQTLVALLVTALTIQVNLACAVETPRQAKPLRIAVAANFAPALKILLADMPNKDQLNYQIISAATGTLYQQIKHGAPFDLLLSADSTRPERLEQDELIIANSRKTYAYGQIALWSATMPLSDLNMLDEYLGKLAIANPDTAPYGKAAQQALQNLSLWPQVKSNLITGINISQTFQQVRSQAVPLGVVANSQLIINQYQGIIIPAEYYQPIAQQLVIIKSSQQVAAAQQISDFILHTNSQKKLQKLGYLPAKSPLENSKVNN